MLSLRLLIHRLVAVANAPRRDLFRLNFTPFNSGGEIGRWFVMRIGANAPRGYEPLSRFPIGEKRGLRGEQEGYARVCPDYQLANHLMR
jgi:hypothetical protein